MKVDGQCHCGAILYEAEVDPLTMTICHCSDCQRLTGSAFRVTIAAPAATFRILQGTPQIYIKTAASGAKRRHAFCGACGSPVYAAADVDAPASYSLRVGTLNQRHAIAKPQRQIWCSSALAWSADLTDVAERRLQQ